MNSRSRGAGILLLAPLFLLLLHACFYQSYGIFRDEFYYYVCGQRPAWGYVDHPPLVGWIAAFLGWIFPQKLILFRFWSFAVAAAHLALVLLWTRQYKGGSLALGLVSVAVIFSPVRLAIDHFFSMNSLEPLLWFGIFWLMTSGGHPLLLGSLIGIGTLNKHSTAIYAVLLSLSFFFSARNSKTYIKHMGVAAVVALVIVGPHLFWQWDHGWPTLEFTTNARLYKNSALSIGSLLGELLLHHHPLVALLWVPGLILCFTKTRWRPLRPYAVTFCLFLLILLFGSGKTYYASALIAPFIAIGALEYEQLGMRLRWIFPALIAFSGLFLMPMVLPVLSVANFQAYERWLGFRPGSGENHEQGALPQQYADMFGWKELAEEVARTLHKLPVEEQKTTMIFLQNYGQAGAIDYYGPGLDLPPASSGHNNYFYWGFHPQHVTQVLGVGGKREEYEKVCGSLTEIGSFDHPLRMPFERHLTFYLCRDLKVSPEEFWPKTKKFI